ncbi:MAG: ABC transporter permease [Planctomycetota bacterium]|jgi:ribose transport system permease protein|nr:ABC transporter permease [Planctomycetota bacterium]
MDKHGYSSPIAEEFAQEMVRRNKVDRIVAMAPVGILLFLVALLSIVADGFFTGYNIQTILGQLSIPLVMSMGLTFVILLAGTDLSGEGLGGFVGSIVILMVLNTKTDLDMGLWAILIAVAAGLVVGIISGVIHVYGKMPSFIVTYAMSSIMAGFAVLSYRGQPAMSKYEFFITLSRGRFLGIPSLTWIALAIFAISYVLQERTRFGEYVFAIGDNERVAKNTGININRIKILVFAWSGLCIGVAGVLGAIRIGRGEVVIGKDTVFPAITAVVVGGTPLTGGRGGVVHSLVGALIVTIIYNGLILLGVSTYIQAAIQGVIIITAVALSVKRGRKVVTK